ncbi:hypothetical protein Mp_7g08300 [Marchantia polymorpha subsp. ruderalis]|uniref:Uncharacterized protein n=2 Tax=Marchantia polymorpha TaxID=3197 RepID=A0AAF6BXD3_MARPO|nr:hypothetical protein MARPO_0146s0030 [Marchantia polymorpha]BBN16667.1 hypothetical protein Mp_7g08300 [Marchantia polymorpha subsp. ruderalis]|eukprot:PTQ29214.1 hypothetical protein MARPO_0146s0030 [Marchantia polymorpha]
MPPNPRVVSRCGSRRYNGRRLTGEEGAEVHGVPVIVPRRRRRQESEERRGYGTRRAFDIRTAAASCGDEGGDVSAGSAGKKEGNSSWEAQASVTLIRRRLNADDGTGERAGACCWACWGRGRGWGWGWGCPKQTSARQRRRGRGAAAAAENSRERDAKVMVLWKPRWLRGIR